MEAQRQKPETAEIRVSYAGEVIDLAGIGVYMRHDLDDLRKEVEAKKIEIRCVLPRTFRDADIRAENMIASINPRLRNIVARLRPEC